MSHAEVCRASGVPNVESKCQASVLGVCARAGDAKACWLMPSAECRAMRVHGHRTRSSERRGQTRMGERAWERQGPSGAVTR